mmetsp:Transcript_8735/g.14540  ORF Transcript_8735/g.14540 Transcript_8735/m.14540 type:complete len:178 (-) Transcript_8735:96-629(-)
MPGMFLNAALAIVVLVTLSVHQGMVNGFSTTSTGPSVTSMLRLRRHQYLSCTNDNDDISADGGKGIKAPDPLVIPSDASGDTNKDTALQTNEKSKNAADTNIQVDEHTEWGVSYIGQDVCGSKYNDDPFDESEDKPDAWTLFSEKVKKIAEKKRREMIENGEIDPTEGGTKQPGRWP